MSQQNIIVPHRPLKFDDAASIDELEQSIDRALKEWSRRENLTVEAGSEKLRMTMLERIARKADSLITANAVARIHGAASGDDARKLALSIRVELSRFVYRELIVMSGLPRRGRGLEFADRDRKIFLMHRSGSSYGKIAKELKISRHAVQAAFRREESRRISFCENYPKLKQYLASIGVLLQEQRILDREGHSLRV